MERVALVGGARAMSHPPAPPSILDFASRAWGNKTRHGGGWGVGEGPHLQRSGHTRVFAHARMGMCRWV